MNANITDKNMTDKNITDKRIIEIFDTTLRDGEQGNGQRFKEGSKSKMKIAEALHDIGVSTIEAGFPVSSEEDFISVQSIARSIGDVYICALSRAMPDEIRKTYEAVKDSEKPMIHTFTHMMNKAGLEAYKKDFSHVMRATRDAVEVARELIGNRGRVEFSAQNIIYATIEAMTPDAQGKMDYATLDDIARLYTIAINSGADVVNFPDTEGRVLPDQVITAFNFFTSSIPNIGNAIMSFHGHNDLGLAAANSLAAVSGGATQIECTINGLGERAGNTAMDEVVMGIWTHSGNLCAETAIKTKSLGAISRLVEEHSGRPVSFFKPIVGPNALHHGAGIHQDGNLKGVEAGKLVYQIFDAATVGHMAPKTMLTARSGKRGVTDSLNALGYDIDVETVTEKVMPHFLGYADTHDCVDDLGLRVVMDIAYPPKKRIEYISYGLSKEPDSDSYKATVIMDIDGKRTIAEYKGNGNGNANGNGGNSGNGNGNGNGNGHGPRKASGPIDAIFSAIDSVIEKVIQMREGNTNLPTLEVYDVRSIGEDHSAEGEAVIVLGEKKYAGDLSLGEPFYVGYARGKDTLEAPIKAYVEAMDGYLGRQTL